MKKRNLNYESKFKKYLFGFDLNTHKEICKEINVKPNLMLKDIKTYEIREVIDRRYKFKAINEKQAIEKLQEATKEDVIGEVILDTIIKEVEE